MLAYFRWRKLASLLLVIMFIFIGLRYFMRTKKQDFNGVGVSVGFSGRLGNHMFQYASLLGIARKNNMTTCVPSWLDLKTVFNIDAHDGDVRDFGPYASYSEGMPAKFFPKFFNLSKQNTFLNGYLQSFKYFNFIKSDILQKQFRFKDKYQSMAENFLRKIVTAHRRKVSDMKPKADPLTIVGIHVRRGDFVRGYTRGYVTPPLPYYYRAMNHFHRKYSNIVFVICSNNILWCQDKLSDDNVYFSDFSNDMYTDLAILASCNHTILSSGTFSWWAGYLNKGSVVYYKDYPRPKSILAESFNQKDYYPGSWIPL